MSRRSSLVNFFALSRISNSWSACGLMRERQKKKSKDENLHTCKHFFSLCYGTSSRNKDKETLGNCSDRNTSASQHRSLPF